MTSSSPGEEPPQGTERSPARIAKLGEADALLRLEMLVSASRSLARALDDYGDSLAEVAETCVPDFCDLFVIELLDESGEVTVPARRAVPSSGLEVPRPWPVIGARCTPDREPVLAYRSGSPARALSEALELLHADSLIVAPIAVGGVTLGWLVMATGSGRRGFRTSALRVAADLGRRLGAAIHRVNLHREAQRAVREQARSARWLRRLASAAAGLAGEATPQGVLEAGCREACIIHDVAGAAAQWVIGPGRAVAAHAGRVNAAEADRLLAGDLTERPARGPGWVSWPLPCTDPAHRAALVLFVEREFAEDEELALRSLASLIPVAFERALGTEITARHEAHLRAVLDRSPVALLTLGADGVVQSANPAALELFGRPGKGSQPTLPDEVEERLVGLARAAAADGISTDTVTTDHFDLAVSAAPLPEEPGQAGRSAVVVATDLSERRNAERALLQAQRLEAMGQVAGRVAHDFNNLLTLIIGYGDLLGRMVRTDEEREMLARIDQAAGRAAQLTQQMLGFTRRQLGTAVVLDAAVAVASLEPVLRRLAGEQVAVTMDVPTPPVKVRCDPREIEQIVLNLAINACDAMGGHGDLAVRVRAVESAPPASEVGDGSWAVLSVTDTGPGMSPEVLERCTEPFFTTKEHGQGSGLGLSTVQGITADRGGSVRIESAPGAGTTVEVWLPRHDAAPLSLLPEEGQAPGTAGGLSARTLLVEDEPSLRDLAFTALTDAGADVVAAGSAEEALDLAADMRTVDVLVTDIRLPGASGVDLARQLRVERPHLPVLFITGYADRESWLADPLPGAALLRKPFRPDELKQAVGEVMAAAPVAER